MASWPDAWKLRPHRDGPQQHDFDGSRGRCTPPDTCAVINTLVFVYFAKLVTTFSTIFTAAE